VGWGAGALTEKELGEPAAGSGEQDRVTDPYSSVFCDKEKASGV